MKKQLLLSLLYVAVGTMMAQSQRKVLIEHFTQASCPPCASVNPIIHPIMERNADKIVRITHQVSWPGVDPMNKDNATDVQARVTYYGVNGVPDSRLDGTDPGSPLETITDDNISLAAIVTSPYEITVKPILKSTLNEAEINVTVKLTGALVGNPILRIAVNEKVISWSAPPGTNGEQEFHHVMKKYLPTPAGTNIKEIATTGTSKTYTFTYPFKSVYDISTLEAVAFIQNDNDKSVLQAEAADFPFVQTTGPDAVLRFGSPSNQSSSIKLCGTSTTAVIDVTSTGTEAIKSIKFSSSINGGPKSDYTYTATSPINYLETRAITIPKIAIPNLLKSGNAVNVEIVAVNGKTDVGPSNNLLAVAFEPAAQTSLSSKLEIKPGTRPDLVSYRIEDENGKVIISGVPTAPNTTVSFPLSLTSNSCYKLTVTNTNASFNCTTRILNDQNVSIYSNRLLAAGTTIDYFTTSELVSSIDENIDAAIELSPNPARDYINISYQSNNNELIDMTIMNISGDIISQISKQVYTGQNNLTINTATLTSGYYFVKINTSKGKAVKKLIIE